MTGRVVKQVCFTMHAKLASGLSSRGLKVRGDPLLEVQRMLLNLAEIASIAPQAGILAMTECVVRQACFTMHAKLASALSLRDRVRSWQSTVSRTLSCGDCFTLAQLVTLGIGAGAKRNSPKGEVVGESRSRAKPDHRIACGAVETPINLAEDCFVCLAGKQHSQ